MAGAEWRSTLGSHPIFSAPEEYQNALLSLDALKSSSSTTTTSAGGAKKNATPLPLHRSSKVVIRGPDIILAVGSELRIATLGHDATSSSPAQYKVLYAPNVEFDIVSMALAPGGKMLAIAGVHQVAVIVLPRPSYHKLVNKRVDCKAIQVGQYYHAVSGSSRVAKIDWHPWNEGGSSLLVLTSDATLREYDISHDTEEPAQTLSFVPPSPKGQGQGRYTNEDPQAREAVSFCVGKGTADWSPLTLFGLMKSGDVYALAPFLPTNASVPRNYIPALEFFVAAKRELIERGISSFIPSHHNLSSSTSSQPQPHPQSGLSDRENEELARTNDHQLTFVHALSKQLLRETGSEGHTTKGGKKKAHVTLQPPRNSSISKYPLARQGPFLFQPAPVELEGGMDEEPEACDIVYLEAGNFSGERSSDGEAEGEREVERLGVVAIVYCDGRVDMCLDIEKVEARWDVRSDTKSSASTPPAPADLPSFTVYESLDLGLVASLSPSSSTPSLLPLLSHNHPSFHPDPLHSGRVIVSHAFGAHLIDVRKWAQALFGAMQDEDEKRVGEGSKGAGQSEVVHLLNTFDGDDRATAPVVGLHIVDNAFVTYSVIAVTSQYQAIPIELTFKPEHMHITPSTSSTNQPPAAQPHPFQSSTSRTRGPSFSAPFSSNNKEKAYISLLEQEPFVIPPLPSRRTATSLPPLSSSSSRPSSSSGPPQPQSFTPDQLRQLGSRVEALRADIRDLSKGMNIVQGRIGLQHREMQRQLLKLGELQDQIAAFSPSPSSTTAPGKSQLMARVESVRDVQVQLGRRLDGVLQRLMDVHASTSGESGLSEGEKAWFAELGRMKREVGGVGGSGKDGEEGEEENERSLWARSQLLKHHLDLLKPQLEELNKKEKERKRPRRAAGPGYGLGAVSGLGSAQLRSVQRRLAQETKILEDAKSQAEELTKWLANARISDD